MNRKPLESAEVRSSSWLGEEQELAFQTMKDKLCNAHVLVLLDGPEDFVVVDNKMVGLHLIGVTSGPSYCDGPKWLFDIDVLTKSINYVLVVAGINTNDFVGIEESIGTGHSSKETGSSQDCILMPLWKDGSLFDSSSKNASNNEPQPSSNARKKDNGVRKESGIDNQERPENSSQDINTAGPSINTARTNITNDNATCEATHADFFGDKTEVDMSNITTTYPVPSTPNTRIHKDHSLDNVIGDVQSGGYTQEEGIDYDEVFAPVARIEAIRLFLAYALFKDFVVYQMDVKSTFMYGKIEEEVYVCQSPRFEDPEFPDRVYKVEKALYGLHQAPRACQDKYVDEILKKFGFLTVKTTSTPMETSKPLFKDVEAEDVDVYLYRSMIGLLMYLIASKPDIMFVVCACARFQVTPKVSHLHAVKRIFRYLKGQPKLGLWYPKDSPFNLEAYTDSDYAGAITNSTTEAEYVAAASCCGQTQKPRKAKRTTEISQSSGSIPLLANETVIKEWEDKMERAATAASSLETEQDNGNINRTQSMATLNESFPQGTGSGSDPRCQDTTLGGAEAQIRYAFIENPTIYVSLIQQFWNTATARTIDNGEMEITATIDGKFKIVYEASIRRHLKLEDSDGISNLPTTKFFEQLALMGRTTKQESVVPQPRSPTQTNVADEATSTVVDVRHGGAATTGASLDAEHGSGNIDKTTSMPHDSPLLRVHTLGSNVGRMQHNELMDLVTKLSDRIVALETDLQQTKKVYGTAFTRLIKKVKKLEKTIKTRQARRKARIVFTAPEEVYTAEKEVSTAEPVSTAGALVSTDGASSAKDKGKAIMNEAETIQTKTKLQLEQERLGYEEALRLQAEIDEEERKRIATVQEEASSFNIEEWDNIQARVEANEEFV
ncbi:putative ribonuclease H-like domain-containing protein [Tanacetum coccineum]